MIADTYQPMNAAQYVEDSNEAQHQMPDDRWGTFVLVLPKH